MIPSALKEAIVPGSFTFFLLALAVGVLLLHRRRDGGRAGRIWLTTIILLYWALSTPVVALKLVAALTPAIPVIGAQEEAHGAGAIVVLGAGMNIHRSRGDVYGAPTRDASLRAMEAARLHRLLHVPIVVTGGLGHRGQSEAALTAQILEQLGVPAADIIKEEHARNTREHARLVPPLLAARGIARFVLVTSRQHIHRSVRAFRAVGASPIPAVPDVYVPGGAPFEMYLPSLTALHASEALVYDWIAWVYYFARGWL